MKPMHMLPRQLIWMQCDSLVSGNHRILTMASSHLTTACRFERANLDKTAADVIKAKESALAECRRLSALTHSLESQLESAQQHSVDLETRLLQLTTTQDANRSGMFRGLCLNGCCTGQVL